MHKKQIITVAKQELLKALPLFRKLALPLSLISFAVFSKWWYAHVIDDTDEVLIGFPFIYKCPGFHTSMSTQYFILEMLCDFLVYVLFWTVLIGIINKFLIKITLNKLATIVFGVMTIIIFTFFILEMALPDNRLYLYRDFDIQIKQTGFYTSFQTKAHLNLKLCQ